ncbi:MAG: hypothetical protein ACXWR0_05140 [Bdellovibrio sp.]
MSVKQKKSNKQNSGNETYESLVQQFQDKFRLPIYGSNSYPNVPLNMTGKYLLDDEWAKLFDSKERNKHFEAFNVICKTAIGRDVTDKDKSYLIITEILKSVGSSVNTEQGKNEALSLLMKIENRLEVEHDERQQEDIAKWIVGIKNLINFASAIYATHDLKNVIAVPAANTHSDSKPNFKIFYGPPGTGKTREARLSVGESKERYKIVQVHPSSSYEDMIEGIKPVTFANGDVKYEVQDGPIKIMSKKASGSWVKSIASARHFKDSNNEFILLNFPIGTISKWFSSGETYSCRIQTDSGYHSVLTDQPANADTIKIDIKNETDKLLWTKLGFNLNQDSAIQERFVQFEFKGKNWGSGLYVIVLDELNRGNVASILGELVFAISEARGTHSDKKAVTLQYSHEDFIWPQNLCLYGTMNSTDVSLDRIDQAIKRRFDFIITPPNPTILKIDGLEEKGLNLYLKEINDVLENSAAEYGAFNIKDKLLGHAIFIPLKEYITSNQKTNNFELNVGLEFKKLWDNQIIQSLLSIFNGSRDELEKFISDKLTKFSPLPDAKNKNQGSIWGWKYEILNQDLTENKKQNVVNS